MLWKSRWEIRLCVCWDFPEHYYSIPFLFLKTEFLLITDGVFVDADGKPFTSNSVDSQTYGEIAEVNFFYLLDSHDAIFSTALFKPEHWCLLPVSQTPRHKWERKREGKIFPDWSKNVDLKNANALDCSFARYAVWVWPLLVWKLQQGCWLNQRRTIFVQRPANVLHICFQWMLGSDCLIFCKILQFSAIKIVWHWMRSCRSFCT